MEFKHRENIVRELMKKTLVCSAHDISHVDRVLDNSIKIAETEENVNYRILIPAVLLHDIAKVKEDRDSTGRVDHAVIGAEMAGNILRNLAYKEDEVERITDCIRTHRCRGNAIPNSLEAKILFDADKIDCLGTIGISRVLMSAGRCGQSLFPSENFEDYMRKNITNDGRIKDYSKHNPIFEYQSKLKHLPDKLFTKEGKRLSKDRVAIMDTFFNSLLREQGGEVPEH